MKKIFYLIVILALGITACTKNEIQNTAEEPVAPVATAATEASVYHFSIPAGIGSEAETKALTIGESTITSTFETTDCIYVHNVTRDAWSLVLPDPNYPFLNWGYLQPSGISADGKNCTLTGDLSFLTYNSGTSSWEECTTVADGDTYDLYYQAKAYYDGSLYLSYLLNADWQSPNGLIDNISGFDYAIAEGVTMSLSGNTLTVDNGTASFVNYGSMFRQRLTFVPGANPGEGSDNPANITTFTISTEHNTMIVEDMILNEDANKVGKTLRTRIDLSLDPYSSNTSVIDANKDIYFALAFDNTALQDGDKLTFKAVDDQYNIYTGSKTIPAGGLQNGKYYYGDLTLTYQYNGFPTITRNDGGKIPVATDQNPYPFDFITVQPNLEGDPDPVPPIDMTITGNSDGFRFYIYYAGTVTLAGNGTAYSGSRNGPFINNSSYHKTVTIILDSDYAISCPNYYYAIGPDSGDNAIKLKTTGGTHTLTLTVTGNDNGALYKGIWYWEYDYDSVSVGDVIPELAADANTTVTLTSASMNVDGNWVFVYTVTTTNP